MSVIVVFVIVVPVVVAMVTGRLALPGALAGARFAPKVPGEARVIVVGFLEAPLRLLIDLDRAHPARHGVVGHNAASRVPGELHSAVTGTGEAVYTHDDVGEVP